MLPPDGDHVRTLPTGVTSLDWLLGGGIPLGSIVFVTGLPGSGKSILSEQMFFVAAKANRSALYLTTLSEPAAKILRYAQGFDFFNPDLLEHSARFADLGSALRTDGPEGMTARIDELIREYRPEFLVIDSFKVMREYFDDQRAFRTFVSDFMIRLTAWEVTALLVGEYEFADITTGAEFAIADGIIHLSGTEEPNRQKRFMNVVKMRGATAFLGHHSYEISDAGITVYPRMIPQVSGDYVTSAERIASAVHELDAMLGGGVPRAAVVLLSGGSGTGKTLVSLSFAVAQVRQGQPCLFVSFEESPPHIVQNCERLGWSLSDHLESGALRLLHISPSELDVDRHAIEIKDAAEELGAQIVVIDSITAFAASVTDDQRVRAYLWGIADHFRRMGITLVLTSENSGSGVSSGIAQRISYVTDVILELGIDTSNQAARRTIRALKVRGSQHELGTKELVIDEQGLRVKEFDRSAGNGTI